MIVKNSKTARIIYETTLEFIYSFWSLKILTSEQINCFYFFFLVLNSELPLWVLLVNVAVLNKLVMHIYLYYTNAKICSNYAGSNQRLYIHSCINKTVGAFLRNNVKETPIGGAI